MMNCTEANYVLPLYVSSELDAKAMADFELHLWTCSFCAREMEQVRRYDELIRDSFSAQEINAADVRARVLELIAPRSPKSFFRALHHRHVFILASVSAVVILFLSVSLYSLLFAHHEETLYVSAVEDHVEEVVQRVPLPGWQETPAEIASFVKAKLGDSQINGKLALAEYHLERVRLCKLAGELYVHFDYRNEKSEFSVYVRPKSGELPGKVIDKVNGCGLHTASQGQFKIVGLQTAKFTIIIVSDLSDAENLRLAHAATQQEI